jgi:hypothetical protein
MSLAAAMLASTVLTSAISPPPICAGCTLDAPSHVQAMPLLVVLQPERADQAVDQTVGRTVGQATRAWRAPALGAGWAVLMLAGWERGEPDWIEDQVFAAARQQSIDLSRVYLVADGAAAAYVARHVQALSETFAAVAITGGGGQPVGCPDQVLPTYFRVEAGDAPARAMRSAFERCRQPVVWSSARGDLDRATAMTILTWLHRHVRVTTVAMWMDPARDRLAYARGRF